MAKSELPPLEKIEMTEAEFRRHNRRSFFKWASVSLAGLLGLGAIFRSDEDRGIAWPLRRINEIGERFWKSQFHSGRAPERDQIITTKPRLNGDIGILDEIDATKWRLEVDVPGSQEKLKVSLADLKTLPQTTQTIEFKCVEGWSEWMTFSGVRFTDFLSAYKIESTLPEYTALSSVDGEYYVAMDTQSMLHPQTLLCLKMNGEELTVENGFPVRLVTAVKYGVKNIKQIGQISFSDKTPADFWAENGYSEYLGL